MNRFVIVDYHSLGLAHNRMVCSVTDFSLAVEDAQTVEELCEIRAAIRPIIESLLGIQSRAAVKQDLIQTRES